MYTEPWRSPLLERGRRAINSQNLGSFANYKMRSVRVVETKPNFRHLILLFSEHEPRINRGAFLQMRGAERNQARQTDPTPLAKFRDRNDQSQKIYGSHQIY